MKITFYSVWESCTEKYTCATLLDNRIASYPTKELAEQHLNLLVPYFIYGDEEVRFSVVEEVIELQDSLDIKAIEEFNNKSNTEDELLDDIRYVGFDE